MHSNAVPFRVTRLEAIVPDGVPLEWQGSTFRSGNLIIELDEQATEQSRGLLDYSRRRASAVFHVCLRFPEFARMLEAVGVPRELTRPVRAILRSEGEILEDHGFAFAGNCSLEEHALFPSSEAAASVLPGH